MAEEATLQEEVIQKTKKLLEEIESIEPKFGKMDEKYTNKFDELQIKFDTISTEHTETKEKLEKNQKELDQVKSYMNNPVANSNEKTCDYKDSAYSKLVRAYLKKGMNLTDEERKENIHQLYENEFRNVPEEEKNSIFNILLEDSNKEQGFYIKEYKALRTDVNPDGGYLTDRPQRASEFSKIVFETSRVREISSVINTSSLQYEVIIDDNRLGNANWADETAPVTETPTSRIGVVKIDLHEQVVQPLVTNKNLDDKGNDVERFLNEKITQEFSLSENTSFITGNGVNKPKGILSYDAWSQNGTYERYKIEQINLGADGGVTVDGLLDIETSLKPDYLNEAIWIMSRRTWREVRKLADGVGNFLLNREGLLEGFQKRLLGYPVVLMEDMPNIIDNSGNPVVGALSIAFGNFKKSYTIIDRFGTRVLRDPYTAKPYVKFYARKYVGGGVTNFDSIKIGKASA